MSRRVNSNLFMNKISISSYKNESRENYKHSPIINRPLAISRVIYMPPKNTSKNIHKLPNVNESSIRFNKQQKKMLVNPKRASSNLPSTRKSESPHDVSKTKKVFFEFNKGINGIVISSNVKYCQNPLVADKESLLRFKISTVVSRFSCDNSPTVLHKKTKNNSFNVPNQFETYQSSVRQREFQAQRRVGKFAMQSNRKKL